ncbi:MAG: phosphomethylpyrimidine synthase ThiC [Firmicutes bacterium]|nr:phosphomethylpyrimidine synthase ThiC [Bacillota bacterium]
MTQMQAARRGEITPAMAAVARTEGIEPGDVRDSTASGAMVIPVNAHHSGVAPVGIGRGCRIKVNANIGTSSANPDPEAEERKLGAAIRAGADAVMDLSTGSIESIRTTRQIVLGGSLPVGTVPIYEAAVKARRLRGAVVEMTVDDVFEVIEEQACQGVDFMTVHCGVTRDTLQRMKAEGRECDVVSRGGAFTIAWMLHHDRENPLFEQFDRLLEIAAQHDVTLSLGDGFRPGCLADATDRSQVQELIVLGELVDRAREVGVQVMVEGPGHMPLDQVEMNVALQKRLCHEAPFYVLGPLVTDVAMGYDHIAAAIGGAVAGMAGADFLCYVTPAEHLGLPGEADVYEGVMAARIAGHAADIVRERGSGTKRDGAPARRLAWERDLLMARARKALDWETQFGLCLDPGLTRRRRAEMNPSGVAECTMCGDYCAMKIVAESLGGSARAQGNRGQGIRGQC